MVQEFLPKNTDVIVLKKIELQELVNLWEFSPTDAFKNEFESKNFAYSKITPRERDEAILQIINELDSDLITSGPHRKESWEKGWTQNLEEFLKSRNLEVVAPKYFGKYPLIRWRQDFIKPESSTMEADLLGLLIQQLVEKYIHGSQRLFEFGCGTGSNLIRLRKIFPNLELYGLDWAETSQELIKKIADETNDKKLHALNFDYFDPRTDMDLTSADVVMTVASLEQTGTEFKKFIDFIIAKNPRIVIHIEPMWEPLDRRILLDFLSIKYFKKRKYLDGLETYIKEMEVRGNSKIVESKRSHLGSFFIDGYSVLVWEPRS